jgi:hypothetical protein
VTHQTDSTETSKSTRESGFNSGILSIDRVCKPGLYGFAMTTDPDTAAKEYAEVMSVIERVREERSRLDTTIATLEGLAERLRLATGAASRAVPLPPDAQSVRGDIDPAVASANDAESTPPPGHYRIISQTTMIADEDGQVIGSESASEPAPKDRGSPEAQVKITQYPATPPVSTSLRVIGLREGSKKHRIYVATVELLKNGSMYIDDILQRLPATLFEGITGDKRNNLSNILSQLKTVGLLVSDNRGNWSLPHRTAAE